MVWKLVAIIQQTNAYLVSVMVMMDIPRTAPMEPISCQLMYHLVKPHLLGPIVQENIYKTI